MAGGHRAAVSLPATVGANGAPTGASAHDSNALDRRRAFRRSLGEADREDVRKLAAGVTDFQTMAAVATTRFFRTRRASPVQAGDAVTPADASNDGASEERIAVSGLGARAAHFRGGAHSRAGGSLVPAAVDRRAAWIYNYISIS